MHRLVGLIGIVVIVGIAYLLSNNKKAVKLRIISWGLILQVIFALFVLRLPIGIAILKWFSQKVTLVISYADKGSIFLFGKLVSDTNSYGFIFAFKVLPIVIFISSFFSILYYLGVMQFIVSLMARAMKYLMGISGAESLSVAANVFMGQTEAPLIIAPYIKEMTYSELLCLMVGGMATVSGAILGGYVALGIKAEYLLSASFMAAPAAVMMAKLLVPETEISKTAGKVSLVIERTDVNIIDAAARGASQGAQLAINIGAMLVAFIALIALINGAIGWIAHFFTTQNITLEIIFGRIFYPLAWIMGVPQKNCMLVGALFGKKIVLNEYIAYVDLAKYVKTGLLTPKAEMIASYALCGFANFSSIGIQIGGIGPLAPNKKHDLARLGLRALIGGSLATYLTATIAGIIG